MSDGMVEPGVHPSARVRPGRKITGISAVLLPFHDDGKVAWDDLRRHVLRTHEAGLTPAVNMDTGYVNLIDAATRERVLRETRSVLEGEGFVAGVYVADAPGDDWDPDAYRRQVEVVLKEGGRPIIFPSYGLTGQPSEAIVEAYARIGEWCDDFIAFELGRMFAPFGRIYDLETFAGLLEISSCTGAKHSSLNREMEWRRLDLRDQRRPDFKIYSGNDLAIDMVTYGSDYLLGLSTFAPDVFARRDALWEDGDAAFYELNDVLQYLGFFAFRPPVPAYKHSAAQFLTLRGWIGSDVPMASAERRSERDVDVLRDIGARLGVL